MDYWRDVHGGGGRSSPAEISYRAVSPLYAGDLYQIRTLGTSHGDEGKAYEIVVEKDGVVCMKSEVSGH